MYYTQEDLYLPCQCRHLSSVHMNPTAETLCQQYACWAKQLQHRWNAPSRGPCVSWLGVHAQSAQHSAATHLPHFNIPAVFNMPDIFITPPYLTCLLYSTHLPYFPTPVTYSTLAVSVSILLIHQWQSRSVSTTMRSDRVYSIWFHLKHSNRNQMTYVENAK